ncbi:MAG: TIGR01777 family oxidoreductase [Flavobacteriaceae bacterium]
MKLLIAGATGLIGTALVEECLGLGIEVHYLTTNKNKIETKKAYRGFYWNPSEGIMDKEAFKGVTSIINLAGSPVARRWTSSCKKEILNSRKEPAWLIFNTLKELKHSVTHYISASGISIYPSSPVQLYDENAKEKATTFLGKVVVEWEKAADRFTELHIKVAKVRTGIVLSHENGTLLHMAKPIKMGFGAYLGNGEQWQSWIHVDDIVGIYLYLLKKELSGVYNAVSPSPVSNKKMMQLIAQQFNKSIWLPNVPKFLLRILLGKMATIAFESQLVSSEKILKEGFQFQYVNLENALEDLL